MLGTIREMTVAPAMVRPSSSSAVSCAGFTGVTP
ncbi:Uncharacterised protein [Mycobacterium tuberculosis]|nr:Uncharacterised protein [Mycobacterium tuberculosis]COW79518.1 Uncharacterised protein [Mycobacterium tuberculosis]